MNPFQMLQLGPEATAAEVMQAAALALREQRHSAREIAEARQLLMEPTARPVLAFLYFTDLAPLLRPFKTAEQSGTDALRRLTIFDRA